MSSLRSLDARVYPLAQWFIRQLTRMGYQVTVTSTRRSLDEQARLYRNFLAGRSRFPAAPPGHSTHALGLAFDLTLNPPDYERAGRLWEALGLTWGGRFSDPIHFDVRSRGTA